MITAIGDVAAPFLSIIFIFALIVAVGALFRSSGVEPSPVRSPYLLPGGVERRGSVGCRAVASSGKSASHVKRVAKHPALYDWEADEWLGLGDVQ